MLQDQDYLKAIEENKQEKVSFKVAIVKSESGEQIHDYKFEDGTVIRRTDIPVEIAQPPGIVIVGYPLKYKFEFIFPETKKGQILKQGFYDD